MPQNRQLECSSLNFESVEGIENHLRTEIRFHNQQTESIRIHRKLHKAAPQQHGS
jgi:hypothetical protein